MRQNSGKIVNYNNDHIRVYNNGIKLNCQNASGFHVSGETQKRTVLSVSVKA